jgi:CheY-like chemotaxis protein
MAKTVLIVDDDPVVIKYLENIFQDNGYETVTASSGSEGEDVLKGVKPDLITLDLQMPEEWGPRFYRKLTKNKDHRDIPVIVISGLTGIKYSIPKAAGYISKPFEPDELLKLVRDTLGESE